MTLRVISTPLRGKELTAAAISGSVAPEWYVPRPRGAAEWRARASAVSAALVSEDWLTPLLPALEPKLSWHQDRLVRQLHMHGYAAVGRSKGPGRF